MESKKDRVKLNVGGRIFETTATTLVGAGRNSLFGAMFDEDWNLHSDAAITEHFFDRDPDCFAVLLNLLRTGELHIPPNLHERLIHREALYYGILDRVRSAKWGTFDGNRLRLARSITSGSPDSHKSRRAVRASPCGGCCVLLPLLYGNNIVKVYDWTLEEYPTINLDYRVNDVCWVNSENIVISSDKNLANGGIGLFSASTGRLRHNLKVADENRLNGFTPGALGVSSDYKLFSSCKFISNEHGIGVWDPDTGKQMSFFDMPPYRSFENASRLQWLDGTNCLMVVSNSYSGGDIKLLDFRVNTVGWSWYDANNHRSEHLNTGDKKFTDAVVVEDRSSICVVDEKGRLGFIDLRSNVRNVNWRERESIAVNINIFQPCHPKLAFHGGQLFSSMNDRISVYSGSNLSPTSQFQKGHGGSIYDFSISGDRLFALHTEDVFDVWETPNSPVI